MTATTAAVTRLPLDVARAALAEVGHPPTNVGMVVHPDGATSLRVANGDPVAYRAATLGLMALHGPDHLVQCAACLADMTDDRYLLKPRCTPIRDVLRGVTCRDGQ